MTEVVIVADEADAIASWETDAGEQELHLGEVSEQWLMYASSTYLANYIGDEVITRIIFSA